MRTLVRKTLTIAVALGGLSFAGAAQAAVLNVLSGDPSWFSTGNSGGGSSGIEASGLLDGDGVARLRGDRTRFAFCANCNPPSIFNPSNSLGLLKDLRSFSFDWTVQAAGAGVQTAQAPALRLHAFDSTNGRFLQFIWEDGEQALAEQQFINGGALGTLGQTYTGDFFGATGDRVHIFTSGGFGRGLFDAGGTLIAGSNSAKSIGDHFGDLTQDQLDQISIFAISVGVGSSVGAGFDGLADGVTIGFADQKETTFNFVAVPEPSTLALFGIGVLGLTFLGSRRRRQVAI